MPETIGTILALVIVAALKLLLDRAKENRDKADHAEISADADPDRRRVIAERLRDRRTDRDI